MGRRGKTALLPRAEARRLQALGVDPVAFYQIEAEERPLPSLGDYRTLLRAYEAKAQRVEWQSGGIAMLRREITGLQALCATLRAALSPDDAATALASRVTLLEAEATLRRVADDWRMGNLGGAPAGPDDEP